MIPDLTNCLKSYKKYFGSPMSWQIDLIEWWVRSLLDEDLWDYHSAFILAAVATCTSHTFRSRTWFDDDPDWEGNDPDYPITVPQARGYGDIGEYIGRGYIPLRWKAAYERASEFTGVDLVTHPERALEHDIAYNLAVHGVMEGVLTGVALKDFTQPTDKNFLMAGDTIYPAKGYLFNQWIDRSVGNFWIKIILGAKGYSDREVSNLLANPAPKP